MRTIRLDVSLICFAFVVIAAVPVTLLRTKTFALGYELGQRKEHEKGLIKKKDQLLQELASKKKIIRDTSHHNFEFPSASQILNYGDLK